MVNLDYHAAMEQDIQATIGLEIHAELKTATKMFCRSKNDPNESRPNVNVCPVCLAHPGVLPVINHEAVRHVLRVGTALGSRLADYTEFDRKNYFYPDLPKGYQISQFEYPLVEGGSLAGISITRIHLEEDTASSIHDDESGTTLVDYNRGGVPLMELVTDPVMHSAEEAGRFARELQLLLRYLGASDANMEKGEMRVEANVSVARKGEMSKTYVEIKNLNSFRTMEKAVEFEIRRQTKLLQEGGVLEKQTLGWDENRGCTFPQRNKEGSADYRYFPDPDLPSLRVSEIPAFATGALRESLPELPSERRERYLREGIKADDVDMYVREPIFGDYIDQVISQMPTPELVSLASNYVANDIANKVHDIGVRDTDFKDIISISASNFSKLIRLVGAKKLSSRAAKDLLVKMWDTDADPEMLAEAAGLLVVLDAGALAKTIAAVLDANPVVVGDYKAGKQAALEYLLGQCMRSLRGAGNPEEIRVELRKALG